MNVICRRDCTTIPSNRITWIDRMRGLAILSVVVQHLTYCFDNQFVYHKIISISNMAVFFFVSGYIIERTARIGNFKDALRFLWKKTIQLMLPFMVWQFIVDKYFFASNWSILTWDDVVNGLVNPSLWFLLTLYGYMFAFAGFKVIQVVKIYYQWGVVYLILLQLMLVAVWKLTGDFHLSTLYFPYFVAGILVSLFNKECWLENKNIGTLSVLVICLCTCFWISGATSIANIVLKVMVSFAVIQIVYIICTCVGWNKKVDSFVQKCGICSLIIYVIHWTFLPMLPYAPILPNNELYGFVITTSLGVVVTYACILIYRLIRQLPLMSFLLFGQKLKNK